jgi:hypothetical protein
MGQYIHNTASPSTHKLRVHKLRVNVYDHTTHIVYTSWQSGAVFCCADASLLLQLHCATPSKTIRAQRLQQNTLRVSDSIDVVVVYAFVANCDANCC